MISWCSGQDIGLPCKRSQVQIPPDPLIAIFLLKFFKMVVFCQTVSQHFFAIWKSKATQNCNQTFWDLKIDEIRAVTYVHPSQFQGLCRMKSSSETLQNLPYFWNTTTTQLFSFSFRATLFFPLMNTLVYVVLTALLDLNGWF